MAWVMCKTASGFLTLDNSEFTAENIPDVLNFLKERFGERLTVGGKFGANLDSAALELNIDGIRITVGCDIWSGVFIMAWDNAGNKIVEEIESFLS